LIRSFPKEDAQDHLFRDEDFVMEANTLKATTNNGAKGKFRKSKGQTSERFRKLTSDPTLEGRDENKVGRIERKIGQAEKALEK
jgi:uncharacterized protein YjbJ (UPF0337 family)